MVELRGIEPQTGERSKPANQSSGVRRRLIDGGAEGDRTPDLDIANVALSQLSYGPASTDEDQSEGASPLGHAGGLENRAGEWFERQAKSRQPSL